MVRMSLKAARVNAGLTQKEVADSLGVSNKTVCSWEKGNTFPSVCYIDKLCKLFGISYDEVNFLPTNSL